MQSLDSPSRSILQRIFKDSRGIFILATHRASPTSFSAEGGDTLNSTLAELDLTNVHAFTGTLTSPPPTPANNSTSLLDSYITSSNFKLIDLLPLSADATRSLIVDTLPDALLYKINDAFIDKIVEASGGHPLYAYELTRSVAEKLKGTSTEKDVSTILTEMEVGVTSNRIEEMICYRFDQLDTSVQMVLKVAAVACSHGAPFTLDMLIYALIGGEEEGDGEFDDFLGTGSDGDSGSGKLMGGGFASPGGVPTNTYDMSSESAREILETILVRGEFIQICQVSEDLDGGSDLDSSNRLPAPINVSGDLLTPHTLLEFKIVLEQITIYNLLVDDQREVFHERVASYYHQKLGSLNDNATHNQVLYLATLIEEAYHWQQGTCYIPAMKANYELAQEYKELKDNHACNLALQTAYSMFMSLKGEHNVPTYVPCSRKELIETFVQSTTEYAGPQVIGGDSRGDDGSKASESVASIWTLETLYSIFNGEIDDLRIALSIHQQLVLNELVSFENPKYILPVAEEGIKMICAVRKPHILANSAVFSSLVAINTSHSKSFKSGGSMRGSDSFKKGASNFYLQDFESFAPPLYFTYALASCMIEGAHMPHDPLFHSPSRLGKGKATLDELMKILSAGSMTDKRYLMAQTQCQLVMFQLISLKMSIATVEHLLSSLLTNYLPLPSNMLEAESYLGIDIAGLTLAFVGQFFILQGEIAKGRKYLAQGIEAVKNMTLPSSAAFAIPPLIASLHLIKDYDQALSLLDDYDNLFGIPQVYQPNISLSSIFSEKPSLHRRFTRSVSAASSIQAAQQLPTVGLRPHFIQKLRVWLMCDRNQNSRLLDLTERILGFSQLTSRMQQQVMKDIINPQTLDGNFWSDFLLFCGLSLPAITAMVFSCHTVMLQGSKLFTNDTLRVSLEEYVKQSAEEHHMETGLASIAAKLYYHQANIKLASVVKALGVNVKNILVPAKLDEQLLNAIQIKVQLPFAAALLGNLALQVTANKELRRTVLGMQKITLETIMQAQEKSEDNNEHDKGLEVKDGKQLWLQRRRLI
ncbi:hypothetical protein EON65_15105 [archaeon]|nr:MAG: hypothetical protein EON65_15105 [archaeon]